MAQMIPLDESGDMTTVKDLLSKGTNDSTGDTLNLVQDTKIPGEEEVDVALQSALNQVGIQSSQIQLENTEKGGKVEVFIGGLDKDAQDDVVLAAVSEVVEGATNLHVTRRKQRVGECRGWATVCVPDLESAQKLCAELREVGGRLVGVHISRGKPLGPLGFSYYSAEYYQPIEPPDEESSLKQIFDTVRSSVDKQGLLMSTIRGIYYPRPYWPEEEPEFESPPPRPFPQPQSQGQGQGQGKKQRKGQGQRRNQGQGQGQNKKFGQGQGATQSGFSSGGNQDKQPPAKKQKKEEIQAEPIEVTMTRECVACTALINKFKTQPNSQNKTALALLHEYAARLGLEVQYEEYVDQTTGLFKCCARLCKTGNVITLFAEGTGSGRAKKDAKQLAAAYIIESLLKKVPEQDFMCSFTREKKKMGNPRAGIGTRTQRFRQVNNPNTSAVAAKSAMMMAREAATANPNPYAGSGTSNAYHGSGTYSAYGTTFGETQGTSGTANNASNFGQKTTQAFKKGGNLTNVTTTNISSANNSQYQQYYQQNQYAGGYQQVPYNQAAYNPPLTQQQYPDTNQQYNNYGTAYKPNDSNNNNNNNNNNDPGQQMYQTPSTKPVQTDPQQNIARGTMYGTRYDQPVQGGTKQDMDGYNHQYNQYQNQYQNQNQHQHEQYGQYYQQSTYPQQGQYQQEYGQGGDGTAGRFPGGTDFGTSGQQNMYETGQKRTYSNMMQQHAPNLAMPQQQQQQQQPVQQQVQQQQPQQQQQQPYQPPYYGGQYYGSMQGGYNQGGQGPQAGYNNM